MADLARRATRWVGTLSDGEGLDHGENVFIFTTHEQCIFSIFVSHREVTQCACQISWWSVEKWRRYYILEFRGNTFRWLMTLTFDLKFWKYLSVTEKSYSMCMSSFMMIGWEMADILHIEISWKHVSVTYDLDLWPKILKIFVSHREVILNVHVKFHDDRLRNDWDITHWNFAETRTHRHGHYNTSPSPYGGAR